MSVDCVYCKGYLYSSVENKDRTCSDCAEHLKKLSEETVNWLLKVIDGRVEKVVSDHVSGYAHESNYSGYY